MSQQPQDPGESGKLLRGTGTAGQAEHTPSSSPRNLGDPEGLHGETEGVWEGPAQGRGPSALSWTGVPPQHPQFPALATQAP